MADSKTMAKLIYLSGLLCFVSSFFAPATPQVMTSSSGEQVAQWTSPHWTHLQLALEPLTQVLEYFSAVKNPDERGDGFEAGQRKHIGRALFSLPASCGWFAIGLSIVIMPRAWMRPITAARARLCPRIAGIVILAAVPLLAVDFHGRATVYSGQFHLGPGADLIVLAYFFIGTSLQPGTNRPAQNRQ
jgi:hypothetical protein